MSIAAIHMLTSGKNTFVIDWCSPMVGFNRKKPKKILIYKGSIHLNDRMAVNFNVISIRFFKTKKSLAQYFILFAF